MSQRPQTLKEAVEQGRLGNAGAYLREFLDEFYVQKDGSKKSAMIAEEPPLIGGDGTFDAYVAAAAEHLAFGEKIPVPQWTLGTERFLKRAHFPGGIESLKATWLMESPISFRRRMIFVESDPLSRPRRDTVSIGM